MLVNKLQENKDKDAEKSQFIIAEAIVMLKKRSIPQRMRALMNVLYKCDLVIESETESETAKITTANSLLSYFKDEMQALREATQSIGYSKKDDPIVIREACIIYRVGKNKK
jgi:hypothetical protein